MNTGIHFRWTDIGHFLSMDWIHAFFLCRSSKYFFYLVQPALYTENIQTLGPYITVTFERKSSKRSPSIELPS